jgi:LytS/YehU family sensor histidine kinase
MSNIWFVIDFTATIPLRGLKELIEYYSFNNYLRSIWAGFYTLILWSTLYFVIKFWLEWKTQKEQTEKAILLAQSAQLQMLRYQVNPHFLFNSLSSLRALVRVNQKQAEKMILQISKFLRYSLMNKKNNQVLLRDEVEALKHYFDIERVRFGNKLKTEIKIDRNSEDVKIPSFLLHPIIENAIKYGMDTSPMPLQIKLFALFENNILSIDVINSGRWIDENEKRLGNGIGIKNVKQRLELAYPDNYTFKIYKNSGAVHVQIKINFKD